MAGAPSNYIAARALEVLSNFLVRPRESRRDCTGETGFFRDDDPHSATSVRRGPQLLYRREPLALSGPRPRRTRSAEHPTRELGSADSYHSQTQGKPPLSGRARRGKFDPQRTEWIIES